MSSSWGVARASSDRGPSRPNVLLIMCDQMRWDAIAAHGNPQIDTPNLDRLVASGTTFRNCHTESPVCVPARATMLTGQLPHRTGVYDNGDVLDPEATTFATVAAGAGYRTQGIGKMHFTPTRHGFGLQRLELSEEIPTTVADDEFLRCIVDAGYGHVEEPHGVRHEMYYVPQVSQLPQDLHTTAWTGRRTVQFIESAAGGPPWLCWTSFIKPHPPFDPPVPWSRKYDPLEMPDPVRGPAEREQLEYRIRAQHRFKWTSPDLPIAMLRTMRAHYYASVSFVDHWIGQILDALERTSQRENTLVVFTADHGEHLGDHWAFGKRTFYDSAARIPLVISRPQWLPAGLTVDDQVGLSDLAPTIVDAIGGDVLGLHSDGQSLLPLLVDRQWRSERRGWIGVLGRDATAVYAAFDDRVKYVYSAGDDLEYALSRSDSFETERLLPGDPLFSQAMELGAALRERLAAEGLGHVLDGDRWKRYDPPPLPGRLDDRSPEGRGLQYAVWTRR